MGVRLVKYGVINGTGTYNHDEMENRDLPDQHPISAITELEDKLKQIDIDISNVPGIEKISNTKSLTLSYDKNTKTLSGNVSITCVKTPSLTLSYNSSSSALTGNVNIFNSEDNAIQQRITGLFVDKYPELELEDTNSIHLYLEGAGETLKTMYENGNVFSHNGGTKNIANESEAKAWYFDDNLNSFVQPKNTTTFTGFVSNIKYKTYTHRATLRSSDSDNDANGLVIAYVLDENGYPHTLSCIVNKGKESHAGNFTYAVVYNRELDGETIVQTGTMSSGHTTEGWSNNFITMEVFKSGNAVECSISDWGSLAINSNTLISINLDNYSWGKYFTGKVQYGYCNQSQANSYFTDIYFKGKGPLKGKVKISTYANNAIQQKEDGIYVDNSYFLNKNQYILLTKFSEDSDNNLLYNGNPIKGNGDVKKYVTTITGDGNTTEFNINHELNSQYVFVMLKDNTGESCFTNYKTIDDNNIQLSFLEPLNSDESYTVIIM